MQKLMLFMGIEKSRKWCVKFIISLLFSALIIIFRPLGLDFRQSLITAVLLLTIIWWSASVLGKIPASLFLLAAFSLLRAAPLPVIFSFPLSDTFLLIVLTYIFSQGIVNSGLIEKIIKPLLFRWCKTPLRILAAIIFLFAATIYIIPQPLARLIIISNIVDAFLKETDLKKETKSILMYAAFAFYTLINISLLDADLIMNRAAVAFGGQEITNWQWAKYMLVPSVFYGATVVSAVIFFFKKELWNIRVGSLKRLDAAPQALNTREKALLIIILTTVLLWMTAEIHQIPPLAVTVAATLIFYVMGAIKRKDFLAIDGTTLIFLTAAFSIGGAMKGSGVADRLFGMVRFLFPAEFGVGYLLTVALVGMLMHMILGSNVTTLSVVMPGLLVLSEGLLSGEMLVYILVVTVSFHAILPFHNVAIMIGSSKGYYPTSYVTKVGLLVTPLVFLALLCFYYPWWRFLGLG